jgi:hypothetical protein
MYNDSIGGSLSARADVAVGVHVGGLGTYGNAKGGPPCLIGDHGNHDAVRALFDLGVGWANRFGPSRPGALGVDTSWGGG